MKSVLCLVFILTFALVLGHQYVQKRVGYVEVTYQSTVRALQRLEAVGVGIKVPDTRSCLQYMWKMKKDYPLTTGVHYKYQTTDKPNGPCYLAGELDFTVSVISETDSEAPVGSKECCASVSDFQAVFLPYETDKNTFTFLYPSVVPWFFTSLLSGCDIFVATHPNQPHKPMVIHSNLNKYEENLPVGLQEKGESVDKILTSYSGYQLIARVHNSPPPKDQIAVNEYLKAYQGSHPHIMLLSYTFDPPFANQHFYFFGHYEFEQWNFILKGATNGDTTVFKVSEQGKVVAVKWPQKKPVN